MVLWLVGWLVGWVGGSWVGWWVGWIGGWVVLSLLACLLASRAEDPWFESRSRRDFSGSSHKLTSDSNICTPVATLPGAWRYRVSTGTGRPGVSIP